MPSLTAYADAVDRAQAATRDLTNHDTTVDQLMHASRMLNRALTIGLTLAGINPDEVPVLAARARAQYGQYFDAVTEGGKVPAPAEAPHSGEAG
jgi:hypothetical protein